MAAAVLAVEGVPVRQTQFPRRGTAFAAAPEGRLETLTMNRAIGPIPSRRLPQNLPP
jgi:hypothetical protein